MSETDYSGLRDVVVQAVRTELEEERKASAAAPTPRYLTMLQAGISTALGLLGLIGVGVGYMQGVQAGFVADRERIARVEYQTQQGLEDRKDPRLRVERNNDVEGQILSRLARIETLLTQRQ